MKICLLPIDSRPCTCVFPQQLAEIAGVELVVPPRGLLGFFKQPSAQVQIATWLDSACEGCDALVISVEQLLYGGLITSRQNERSVKECLAALQQLRALKKRYPGLRIYANNILMRTTVSAVSEESWRWWSQVSVVACLTYKAAVCPPEEKTACEKALNEARQKVPPAVLEQFFAARARNNAVNHACVALAAEGVLEQLLILQEDCSEQSLQWLDQKELEEAIEKNGLREKVFLHNGADEASMEQLMLAAAPRRSQAVQVVWLGGNTAFTARYEDRPFAENLAGHMRALNLYPAHEAQDCLCILPPLDKQGDYCPQRVCDGDYSPEQRQEMAKTVADLYKEGHNCYLLDIAYANGGDPAFIQCLAREMPLLSLCGYAAWNTASNSLGTILGQLCASNGQNGVLNRRFTAERLLDDLFYQSTVREKAERRIHEAGLDFWGFSDRDRAQRIIDESFADDRPLLQALFKDKIPGFTARLYWPRTFELEILLKPQQKV